MAEPKSLDSVLPPEMSEFVTKKVTEFLDKPLIIHSCREVNGQRGTYMRMVVSLTPEGDKFHMSTGASQPVEILAYLDKNRLFPVSGRFVKNGDAIILKA